MALTKEITQDKIATAVWTDAVKAAARTANENAGV
jgi:hypothetical protein